LQNSPRTSLIDLGLPTLRNVACFRIPAPPPPDCQYTTEQHIFRENVEKYCSKGLWATLPSEAAAFSLLTIISSSDHQSCGVGTGIRKTRQTRYLSRFKEYPRHLQPARVRPGQQEQTPTSTQRAPRIFCSHPILPSQGSFPSCFSLTFGRTFLQPFPQDTSPSYSSLTFGQPTL